jgi:hypothetical protein
MSTYTTEVRYICEVNAGYKESQGFSKVNEILTKAAPLVFDFDFPIFDEAYRLPLEVKILRHFYTREICAETVGLWKLWLEATMNEIMPYYNQLYKSELLEFNPLYDVDLTTTHKGSGTNKGTDTRTDALKQAGSYTQDGKTSGSGTANSHLSGDVGTTTTNSRTNKYSDTPQGRTENLTDLNYLTNYTVAKDDDVVKELTDRVTIDTTSNSGTSEVKGTTSTENTGTQTTERDIATTDDYVNTVRGKSGGASFAKTLQEFRKTFLNIDRLIINDLEPLFMGLW